LTTDERDSGFWANRFQIELWGEKDTIAEDPHGCCWLNFRVDELGVNAEEGVVEGFIKWDGCSNSNIQALHLCGYEGAAIVEKILRAVYALARPLFSHCEYQDPPHGDLHFTDVELPS
jgi:hypothetical protein